MPNPISSAQPSTPSTIDLEPVIITGKAQKASSEQPVTASSLGDLALQCLPKLDGVALALLTNVASPIVGSLVGLKAGLELGQCVREDRDEDLARASLARAFEECRGEGGVPSGVPGDMTCTIPAEAP